MATPRKPSDKLGVYTGPGLLRRCKMKLVAYILSRFLPLACLTISACAPQGIMTYKSTKVYGKPRFLEAGDKIRMQIVDVNRPKGETIWWNNHVLDQRHIDTSRKYRFEIEEGKAVYSRGSDYSRGIALHTDVSRVYDDQRLIYDASFCRVHSLTMPRTNRQGAIDAEMLPRGFDTMKAQRFPNSRFDHPRCSGMSAYSSLDWTCPQCSEAETEWLGNNSKSSRE